jgi:lycopene beta-cyclase
MPEQYPKVDYFFAGAGASATLLLMSMERRGLLEGKSIVISDPDTKRKNDKTYCFWGIPDQFPTLHCQHLISHQWQSVRIDRNAPESLAPMQYLHISGLTVYNELRRIVEDYGLQRLQTAVQCLESTEDGVIVTTEEGSWLATTVLDSRPPRFQPPKANEAHLLQSFLGYVVETKTSVVETDCVALMDFNVEQQGHTQFMYVLPFGPQKMLVELTRFGDSAIETTAAELILNNYISTRYGAYTVVDTEMGCIPMSNTTIDVQPVAGVINIGGRGGAIKPSTGYAFKNMLTNAETLADCLRQGTPVSPLSNAPRFRFYDRLLLMILSRQPNFGKPIFQTLFRRNRASAVFQFMDEKTTLWQDLRILLSLPLAPFLKTFWTDLTIRYRNTIAPFLLFVLTLILCVLQMTVPVVANYAQVALLALGLFSVGIPHGALDHLTDTGNIQGRPSLRFVVGYLAAAAACLVLWLMLPVGALLFFLAYSIWHFGQADMQEWQVTQQQSTKTIVWGFLLFGIILLGHIAETNHILSNMAVFTLPFSPATGTLISYALVLGALLWGIWERRPALWLCACMLGVSIHLPLITAFGLYFIGQHSFNVWSHLKKGLNTTNGTLFIKALPFTAGAFFLFALLLYGVDSGRLGAFNRHWITAFFVFISCISFPHVLAMNRFYQKFFSAPPR